MSKIKTSQLKIRVISALFAVGILALSYLFFDLTGIVVLAIGLELIVIKEGLALWKWNQSPRYLKLVLGASFYILFLLILFMEVYRFQILISVFILWILIAIHFAGNNSLDQLLNHVSRGLMSMIYLTLFPALLIDILFKYQGGLWFLSLLAMVFAGDIGAFAFGVTLGKKPVLPLISPKKTWEGSIGGVISTVLTALIIHLVAQLQIPMIAWLIMSLLISIVAQSGDFFESLLKRTANVKDSGSLMPGHGGILDRIDGLIFAAPIMSVALTLFDQWI